MTEFRQGRLCPRGHDDGTGHSLRYANGTCIACMHESNAIAAHRRASSADSIAARSAAESARARLDVIADLVRRDHEPHYHIARSLHVSMHTVRAAVYLRAIAGLTIRTPAPSGRRSPYERSSTPATSTAREPKDEP